MASSSDNEEVYVQESSEEEICSEESDSEESLSEESEEIENPCKICQKKVHEKCFVCETCSQNFHKRCKVNLDDKVIQVRTAMMRGAKTCSDLGRSCEVEDKEMAPALDFIGSPVKCTRDRSKAGGGAEKITVFQYEKMTVSGVEFEVGNYAKFNDDCEPIGVITSVYQTQSQKFNEETKEGFVDILWFYRHNETANLRKKLKQKVDENEIFLQNTDAVWDPMPVASINEKVQVYIKQEYNELKDDVKELFFCSRQWNDSKRHLRALPNFETTIEIYIKKKQEREMKSKKKKKQSKKKQSDYQKATSRLQLSYIPKKLPCREEQYNILKRFLKDAIIKEGHGSGYYISGMPGTGKTATVNWIIRELNELAEEGDFPEFDYLEINAMKLQKPQEAYSKLYYKLEGVRASWSTSLRKLEETFTSPSNRNVLVVLIDELDYFVTRKQKVLYNFFDWPSRRHTKLVVLGIANTMDLPERLQPRVQSRIGINRLEFPPYSSKQIKQIIEERLKSLNIFNKNAIRFCSMKASNTSGDIRRALQICRRAAEIRQLKIKSQKTKDKKSVQVADINDAVNSLFACSVMETIQNLPLYTKIVLCACLMLLQRKKLDFENIYVECEKICRCRGIAPVPDEHIFEEQCNALRNLRLVSKEWERSDPWSFVLRLCCEPADAKAALDDHKILGPLLDGLSF